MASPLERLICDQLLVEAQRLLEHAPAAAALEPVALAPSASAEVPCSLDRTLGGMREEAARIGMELYPLTTVAEVAALVASALLYPSGTPFRASRMRTELHIRGVHLTTDYELTRLLQRLEASGGWAELLATLRVRGEKRCTLVPPVTACVVCDGTQGVGFNDARTGRPTHPTVFACDGPRTAELSCLVCADPECATVHSMSFASGGRQLPAGTQICVYILSTHLHSLYLTYLLVRLYRAPPSPPREVMSLPHTLVSVPRRAQRRKYEVGGAS